MKFNNKMRLTTLFALTVLISQASYADATFPYNGEWWLNAGIGVATGKDSDMPLPDNIPPDIYNDEKSEAQNIGGTAGEVSLNFATASNQLLTVRYFGSTDRNTVGFFGSGVGDGHLQEGAVMYGLMAKAQYGYISGSAGISAVNTWYPGGVDDWGVTFNHVSQTTVGLPLEIQAFFTPIKYIGIGIVGVGDVNAHAPVAAALLELQIGNLI